MVCLVDLSFLVYACNNSTEFGCGIISWQTPPSHLPLLCLIVMQFICKESSNFRAAMSLHNILIKNKKRKEISLAFINMVMLNKTKMKECWSNARCLWNQSESKSSMLNLEREKWYYKMDDTEFVGKLKKQDKCPVKAGDLANCNHVKIGFGQMRSSRRWYSSQKPGYEWYRSVGWQRMIKFYLKYQ